MLLVIHSKFYTHVCTSWRQHLAKSGDYKKIDNCAFHSFSAVVVIVTMIMMVMVIIIVIIVIIFVIVIIIIVVCLLVA